jgi:hypothetical protein
MRPLRQSFAGLLLCASAAAAALQSPALDIPTSDAVDVARLIARAEGYDVSRTDIYSFEQLTNSGKPFHQGYVAIGFNINGNARNLILINARTGQAIDYNTCEIFDFPSLRPFQVKVTRLTKAEPESPEDLADEVGCANPKVLTRDKSKNKTS